MKPAAGAPAGQRVNRYSSNLRVRLLPDLTKSVRNCHV
jgi:hypothetical protein